MEHSDWPLIIRKLTQFQLCKQRAWKLSFLSLPVEKVELKANDFLRPVRELRLQGQLPPPSGESDDFRKSWPGLLVWAEALGAVTGREHLNGNFDKLL